MKQILVAVLLSALVGPGAGQLYNREFKKAWILISFFLLIFSLLFFAVIRASYNILYPDPPEINYQLYIELKQKLFEKTPVPFRLYNIIMIGLWVFGVVDAYYGAKRRLARDK